ncbi:MAG: thioesterase [Actinophytocola sp.]|uniref:acyl-CoA thioesterase n=1 Tax=Actinophytocola sp. TaxID=1872138 RepID=UPI0013247F14|nr:acyl-CoA thioesterase [Actinophytocola sp.]MPZ81638.1 thioesterase [Actinophytocola sp.]
MTFRIPIVVRSYELDALGHVNHAVYHQYAEVARMNGFRAAGCDWDGLMDRRAAPVLLSTTANFRRELRANEEIDVSCEVKFGTGKTFNINSMITKADGTVAAEVYCIVGVMDIEARKLFVDPRAMLESGGFDPAVLSASD